MNSRSIIRDARSQYRRIPHQDAKEAGGQMGSLFPPIESESARYYKTIVRFHDKMEDVDIRKIPGWKRTLDLVLIVASIPCWLVLMVLVTIWIKIASPGPIFYRQQRVGSFGRRFMVLKFRSMKVNVETLSHERYLEQLIQNDRPMTKLDVVGDCRIIPLGKFLRATGLDELPQIWNILRGEMSLVGPRPCTPNEYLRYEPWHRKRVNAPPGLTGFWQVNGKNKTTFNEMIEMDIYYGEHMSFRWDCAIIAKTLPAIWGQITDARRETKAKTATFKGAVEL